MTHDERRQPLSPIITCSNATMAAPERCSRFCRPVVRVPLWVSMLWAFVFVNTVCRVSCLQQPSSSRSPRCGNGPTSCTGIRSGVPCMSHATTVRACRGTFERSWRRQPQILPAQRRSALFSSSPDASIDGDDGKKEREGGRRRSGGGGRWISKLNPVPRIKKIVASIIAFQAAFRTRFAALPRKAKLVVLAQLLALSLVVGSVGRKV